MSAKLSPLTYGIVVCRRCDMMYYKKIVKFVPVKGKKKFKKKKKSYGWKKW